MNKISNTWELAKVSWGVLRDDKELALLPVLANRQRFQSRPGLAMRFAARRSSQVMAPAPFT